MKTYHIVEEETIRAVYEIEVPDEVAAKGADAIYDYWYNVENPTDHLIESECRDVDAIDCYEVTQDVARKAWYEHDIDSIIKINGE